MKLGDLGERIFKLFIEVIIPNIRNIKNILNPLKTSLLFNRTLLCLIGVLFKGEFYMKRKIGLNIIALSVFPNF